MAPSPKAIARATILRKRSVVDVEGKSDPQGKGWERTTEAFDPQNVQSKIPYPVLI